MRMLAVVALISSCGPKPSPAPEPPAKPLAYAEVADRLEAMSDAGWIVSRDSDGAPQHQGDSLIWTGVAMGVLDCARGEAQEKALLAMLAETGGTPYRHPSLKGEWSLDGELGLLFGIKNRVARCPETRERWRDAVLDHAAAVSGVEQVPLHFYAAVEEVAHEVAGTPAPTESDVGSLGSEVAIWAAAVVADRASGYRIHLGYLTLKIVTAPKGHTAWCYATRGARMPLVEHECNRNGLDGWIEAFQYDAWEYGLQRALAWETPDGQGLATPGLDYLVGLWAEGLAP